MNHYYFSKDSYVTLLYHVCLFCIQVVCLKYQSSFSHIHGFDLIINQFFLAKSELVLLSYIF